MQKIPQEWDIYRHFKGKDYLIVGVAHNCTNDGDGKEYVVYKRMSDDTLHIRTNRNTASNSPVMLMTKIRAHKGKFQFYE